MNYLNTKETAKNLRVSPRTLEKKRVEGSGPAFIKVGRLVFYTEEAITAWINSRTRRSTSDPGQGA